MARLHCGEADAFAVRWKEDADGHLIPVESDRPGLSGRRRKEDHRGALLIAASENPPAVRRDVPAHPLSQTHGRASVRWTKVDRAVGAPALSLFVEEQGLTVVGQARDERVVEPREIALRPIVGRSEENFAHVDLALDERAAITPDVMQGLGIRAPRE